MTKIKFITDPVFKHALMTMRENGAFYRQDLHAGDARWSDDFSHLAYSCPCGCGLVNMIPIADPAKNRAGWIWDGDKENPTLKPSIAQTVGCKWHGHLVKGEFKSV